MSKLEELIAELCPDGVKYIAVKDCVDSIKNIKWASTDGGKYQYIDLTSVDRDTHLITETQVVNKDNAPSRAQQIVNEGDILLGATRPMLKRYCMITEDFNNQVCSTGFSVLRARTGVVLRRWLYYQISSTAFFNHVEKFQKGASYPAISDADVKAYIIPVPPLEVQSEIVRILDNFTEIIADLTVALSSELTARKKQYEFYRKELLNNPNGELEEMAIGDIYDFKYGKGNKIPEGTGEYPVYGSNGIVGSYDGYNSEDAPVIGHIGAYAGIVHWGIGKHFVTYNGVICKCINDKVISKYGYYLLLMQDYLSMANSGSQPFVSYDILEKPFVKIPPLMEQQRIVDILDRFDTLCNDISTSLPAEIEARRKQYEYYRDKLLTFKELS